jgi:hypothetical protein
MSGSAGGSNSGNGRSFRSVPRKTIVLYASISLASFLCFWVLYQSLLANAGRLAELGLTNAVLYSALVTLALTPTCIVFGALRSYGLYKGQVLGATVEFGGSASVFLVVLVLGYNLLPASLNFPLTVNLHGTTSSQLLIPRKGKVLIDFGGDRRDEPISEKGQAKFSEIPANFRGKEVSIFLDAAGYELASPDQKHVLNGDSIYLEVRKKAGHVLGHVKDEAGSDLADVTIRVGELTAQTNASGRFDITIPGDQMQDEMPLEAFKAGYMPLNGKAVPNANELMITLTRRRRLK